MAESFGTNTVNTVEMSLLGPILNSWPVGGTPRSLFRGKHLWVASLLPPSIAYRRVPSTPGFKGKGSKLRTSHPQLTALSLSH